MLGERKSVIAELNDFEHVTDRIKQMPNPLVKGYFNESPFLPELYTVEEIKMLKPECKGCEINPQMASKFLGVIPSDISKIAEIDNALLVGSKVRNMALRLFWARFNPELLDVSRPYNIGMEVWSRFFMVHHDVRESDLDIFIAQKGLTRQKAARSLSDAKFGYLPIKASRTETSGFKAKTKIGETFVDFLFFERECDLDAPYEWTIYQSLVFSNAICAKPLKDGGVLLFDLVGALKADPTSTSLLYLDEITKKPSARLVEKANRASLLQQYGLLAESQVRKLYTACAGIGPLSKNSRLSLLESQRKAKEKSLPTVHFPEPKYRPVNV